MLWNESAAAVGGEGKTIDQTCLKMLSKSVKGNHRKIIIIIINNKNKKGG
jgi:hypothetical protein